MDRIWEEGENSQGRSLKLWLEQLGGEDHWLRREKVNPAYLLSPTVTDPASRRESCCEAGKTACRSQPRAHRGAHRTVLHLWEKSRALLCFRDNSLPALHPALSTPGHMSSLWGKWGRFLIPFSKHESTAHRRPSSELEARGKKDKQDLWVQW